MVEIEKIEENLKKLLIERDCVNSELNKTNRQLSDVIKTYIENNCKFDSEVEIAGKSYTFSCGKLLDRDINAAINIKNEGINIINIKYRTLGTSGSYACGDSVRHLVGMQLSLKQEAPSL